jgi:hypothetical protein
MLLNMKIGLKRVVNGFDGPVTMLTQGSRFTCLPPRPSQSQLEMDHVGHS